MTRVWLLVAVLALTACGDGSTGAGGVDIDQGGYYTCSASLTPGTLDYDVQGAILMVTDANGYSASWSRQGTGTDVYDSWLVADDYHGDIGMNLRLIMSVAPGSVTLDVECSADAGAEGFATASSAAEITDTTITILEADSSEIRFE